MMKKPVDINIREEVKKNFADSLFITAGAGTGKTHSIVSRVVEAITKLKMPPEKIAVMTFTEKAANELLYRIRQSLEKAGDQSALHLQKMFIGTIHSFCLLLLRERPLESGIAPDTKALDEEESGELIDSIGEMVIREYFTSPGMKDLPMKREFDPMTGIGLFHTLNMYRDLTPVEPADPGIPLEGFWQRHSEAFSEIPGLLARNDNDNADGLEWIKRNYGEWLALETKSIDEIISFFARLKIIDPKKKSWPNVKIGDDRAKSLVHYLLAPFKDASGEIISQVSYDLYLHFRRLYDIFNDRYGKVKGDLGALDFSDMLIKARGLIRDNLEARKYFQDRFDLVIVDEFQDTDPVMAEMLMYICQDGYDDVPWKEIRPKPGKLTVVGDEKQSIYRFRRADISIYGRIKEIFRIHGKVENLQENFRSVESLVENHNHAFGEIFPTGGDSGIDYAPIHSYRGKGECMGEENLIFLDLQLDLDTDTEDMKNKKYEDRPLKMEHRVRREAMAVCRWIKETVESKGLPMNGRSADYGDFMLLFKRRKFMKLYAGILSREGIPVAMDGEGFLLELPEVIDTFRFLDGCVNHDSPPAVVSALRSIYCGVSDSDLYDHRLKGGTFRYFSIDESLGNKNVNSALGILKGHNRAVNGMPPARGFRKILETGKIKYILNQTRPVMGLNIFDAVISYIDSRAGESLSPSDIMAGIMEDICSGKKLDPMYYPFKGTREVRLLTAHKAKGLESPVVILCDLGSEGSDRVNTIFDRENDRLYYKFGLEKRDRYRDAEYKSYLYETGSSGFEDRVDDEKKEMSREDDRVTYVAATRARDYLVIPFYHDKPAALYKKLIDSYRKSNMFTVAEAGITDADEELPLIPMPHVALSSGDTAGSAAIKKIAAVEKKRKKSLDDIISHSVEKYEKRTFSHEKAMVRETEGYGSGHGTLFHRSMELIIRRLGTGGEIHKEEALKLMDAGIDGIAAHAAEEAGVDITADGMDLLRRHVRKAMASPEMAECLKAGRRIPEFPVDLVFMEGGKEIYSSGIIDLVYFHNNTWKIIDYKTDKIDNEQHLAALREFYRDQVEGYASAFFTITGEKPVAQLLFVDWQ